MTYKYLNNEEDNVEELKAQLRVWELVKPEIERIYDKLYREEQQSWHCGNGLPEVDYLNDWVRDAIIELSRLIDYRKELQRS